MNYREEENLVTGKRTEQDRKVFQELAVSKRGLETRNLAVGYGKQIVIHNVELQVVPGKIVTLIGKNGSGKSTILKSIIGQLKPLGGSVVLCGKETAHMKEAEIAKELSMVMTERIQPELMTGKDVVATGRYPYTGRFGILSKEDWHAVDEAITLVHANDVENLEFSKLSDGQKQRIMLARAICQDTKVLVLDEPTSYLDMRYKLDILSSIRKLAHERGMAVIMSLHELDLAQKISDTIACVKGDRIDKVGAPEEIFSGDYVQTLYGVSEKSFHPLLGMMQLPANEGTPKVFVIGGGGAAIPVYYRLQRENIPFIAGILYENDIEYAVAKSLAANVVTTRAFFPIQEETIEAARQKIDFCEACICTIEEFGPYNEANEKLLSYAKETKKLLPVSKLDCIS